MVRGLVFFGVGAEGRNQKASCKQRASEMSTIIATIGLGMWETRPAPWSPREGALGHGDWRAELV